MKSLAVAILPLLAIGLLSACGDSSRPASVFWDGTGDVHGSEAFIQVKERELDRLVGLSDAVVEVNIRDRKDVQRAGPVPNQVYAEDPNDEARLDRDAELLADMPLTTIYSANVKAWIKGEGDSEIDIAEAGGTMSDGSPVFPDGSFLLEPGRTYVLLLTKTVDGGYRFAGWAREGFDLTNGVKVLDHPDTRDLEYLEDMPVHDFESYIAGLASDRALP